MTEREQQKYREAIYQRHPEYTDTQIDLLIEMIEALTPYLEG